MKNLILISVLFLSINTISQEITRGPEIGEIYFMGPTTTVLQDAIYHSTDFGETAVCVDSVSALTNIIAAMAADKTPGVLYFVTMGEALYYSGNYGQFGSWELRSGGIYDVLLSGVSEGYIFEGAASHSEDFGYNFINHANNGAFGTFYDAELDVEENVCYLLTKIFGQNDTLYLFKSEDNYQNATLLNKFNMDEDPVRFISRGNESGELYTFIEYANSLLRFSNDFGCSWETKNNLYFNNYSTVDFTGGRQAGEVYFLVTYLQLMGQIKHVFIYHSLDYGETFTQYHPFAYGPDPFYVAFKADTTTGCVPLNIQFIDESSGEDLTWEWDFDNDGMIDSYEQNPTFIYTDTGYYDVKLTVTNPYNQYSLVKDKYIYVKDTTTLIYPEIFQSINIYPNPVTNKLIINIPSTLSNLKIFVFNSIGEIEYEYEIFQEDIIIDFSNYQTGIYFLNIKDQNNSLTTKIIKI